MSTPYLNRELSWLEFNQRVLNEALREDLPLLERVKFLAITASNMDEFFQVRIGGLMLMRRSGRKTPDASGLTPTRNLAVLRQRILKMCADQYTLLTGTLVPAMEKAGILPLHPRQLTVRQAGQVEAAFEDLIFPLLTPLAVDPDSSPPVVPALQITVACRLLDPETQNTRYALIPIPEALGRRIHVSVEGEGHAFVLIEDLVASQALQLFPGENVISTTAFRVTRNGDIAVQEEDAIDLAGEMEDVLTARRFADTVRLELRSDAPRDLVRVIKAVTGSGPQEIYRVDGPPGLASFMELAFLPGFDHLRDVDWPAQNSPAIAPGASMFETIASNDVLLFHPYESFEPVLRLIEEAAEDPDVIAIKQVLYRTARKSRIIDALIKAAENGKHVTALVELKARFDEARNLDRADELQRAGAQIVYGVKGLKTHAKICLIVRREAGRLRRYAHLGTGNYNETTSRLYTDLSYLTCKPEYGNDASLFFNAVTGRSKLLRFQRLVPAPTAMKPTLLDLIASEAERAKQGLPARIIGKVNSLQDPDIINALYKASQAGVEIKLNIRGICCLKPGDPKYSKNIEVISVIDRFLEHARLFYFHQGGNPEVYIASADWMTRNLEKRVELMIPIEEPALKRRLVRILEAFFQDNTQASRLMPDGTSQRIVRGKGQKAFRVQEHFHQQARKAAKAREHERAMTFEPHVPAE
ncbi:polyphosphate kinase 1 [Luteolibacter yonseiensis]|uniref:Polyphosphate kinase n=1 Tax=Luteolibacter yonseiensis TaxID=1144680 RepID=A0A934RB87_9BACT|nr:polyphosphate kinase 1 [Luteolibacter yonseiensis]MBK1818389.1 polyphosphate kinase 1 [Luteolibacter yonseiensis]